MSRTIPAVDDNYVVTIGPRCHVMCVDAEDGEFLWGLDLVEELGAEVPLWYTGQCPLIDNGIAVLAVGGEALLIGVDCATGRIVWRTPNPSGWKMSHSSVMPMRLAGIDTYVYCADGGVVGVAADGADAGRILWQTGLWSPKVCVPSPIVFDDGRIFATAGYGAGSMMLRVTRRDGGFGVESLYRLEPEDGMACEQQTPLLYEGHLFSILPKDAGGFRNRFVCYDPDGEVVWSSSKSERFGLGPFLLADGKFLILDDWGVLTLAEATTEEFRVLDRARILQGRDAWGPMALAGGRLLARDSGTLVCVDMRAEQDG
jgi:outer membrane protein assembly factor BamB